MTKIKICGISNEKEIEYLNILKPEYMGFVFTKSKRQVIGSKAKALYKNLDKGIKTVGVFKNNSISEILEIIKEIQLDVIQLHGVEDENFIFSLKANISKEIEIWKALSISDTENIKKYFENKDRMLIDNFLVDGDSPGSGQTFSLDKINELFTEKDILVAKDDVISKENNFFLAGGITPENVTKRICEAKPIGIDVSSGVEIIDENGIRTKSFKKMKTLIESVRNG